MKSWGMVIFLLGGMILGCSEPQSLTVATSVPAFSKLLQEVLGTHVRVLNIAKDPSSLEGTDLSLKVMRNLGAAKLYFSFELPLEQILQEKHLFSPRQWVRLDSVTPPEYFSATTDTLIKASLNKEIDPHFWMSPRRMERILDYSVSTLVALYPEYATEWGNSLGKVKNRLSVLDEELKTLGAKRNLSFLVFHPALGYLAKDYHLTQFAIEKEGKETSLYDLVQMIPAIKSQNVRTLYLEPGTPSRLVDGLKEGLQLRTIELNVFGGDFEMEIRRFIEGLQ